MKVLVAITSCARDVINGNNQAARNTWLKKLSHYKEFDYKFFLGVGSPLPLTEEHPNFQRAYHNLPPNLTSHTPILQREALVGDEILLDVPDSYPYLPYKIRESRRWALNEGYDYIFKCDVDTFIHPARLQLCGYQEHDYIGYESPLLGPEVEMLKAANQNESGTYAGGVSYWLSRKSCEAILNAPINILTEDVWTGYNLHLQGIHPHNDCRYCYYVGEMDNTISVHLGTATGEYNNEKMYETSILFDKYRAVKPLRLVKRRFMRPFRSR